MYNKQQWLDEIPDMSRPILDGSGKQKTDPQTGRPLFELVQAGTRITSARLNTMEGGIEEAHVLIEQLAKELAGNFVAVIDGVMGLQCSTQGLTASWTAGVAYVRGRRFEVSAGNMTLNPTQGQYLYVDADGTVKKTTSQATAKAGVLLFYVATDASGVISSTDQRVNISLEEILMKLENIDVPDASLTEKGIVQLSNATNGTRENVAATEKAVKAAYDEALAGKQLGVEQKANVVAALNSIGVSASTSESWAQLIPKISAVIRATGNANPEDVLSGKIFSNATGNNRTGSMPHLTGNRPATGAAIWPDGALAVYPERGYQKGGAGDGEIKVSVAQLRAADPNLAPENIRSGRRVFGVDGTLQPSMYSEGQFSLDDNNLRPNGQFTYFPLYTIPAGVTIWYMRLDSGMETTIELARDGQTAILQIVDSNGLSHNWSSGYVVSGYTNAKIAFAALTFKARDPVKFSGGESFVVSGPGGASYVNRDFPANFNLSGPLLIRLATWNGTGSSQRARAVCNAKYIQA